MLRSDPVYVMQPAAHPNKSFRNMTTCSHLLLEQQIVLAADTCQTGDGELTEKTLA